MRAKNERESESEMEIELAERELAERLSVREKRDYSCPFVNTTRLCQNTSDSHVICGSTTRHSFGQHKQIC
jgi:hypothetical protein